jgi:activating signal cointegrator complex subunit 1
MSFPKNEGLDKAIELLRSLKPREILAGIHPSAPPHGIISPPPPATPTKSGDSPKIDMSGRSTTPLSITLRGLHTMQTASQSSVLYAPPADKEGLLQSFCEDLKATFQSAGLMVDENRPLLLHATIVNTIYVKGGRSAQPGNRRGKLMIDARDILDRYEDYVWMDDVKLEKIAICRMGAKKVEGTEDEEAYEVEAEIDI